MLKCFVATKIVVSQALSLGLKTTQIVCHGLPIRPSFSIPSGSRAYLREKLGMHKDARTVMLIGGGEGMGKITEIEEELSRRFVCAIFANFFIMNLNQTVRNTSTCDHMWK